MNVKGFEKKYGDKGGMKRLTELRSLMYTQSYIAKEFGVSREAVRLWFVKFFGKEYDAREDRKNAIVENMVDFARHNVFHDFKSSFHQGEYYKQALDRCYQLEIYIEKDYEKKS